jgi:hypothetical protein
MTTEKMKYTLKFLHVLIFAVPILVFTQGGQALRVIAYKVALVSIAVAVAEFIWALSFKPAFGKTEIMRDEERHSVLVFRGILYAAIIASICLGL